LRNMMLRWLLLLLPPMGIWRRQAGAVAIAGGRCGRVVNLCSLRCDRLSHRLVVPSRPSSACFLRHSAQVDVGLMVGWWVRLCVRGFSSVESCGSE
jgi:hypothetical protein